MAEPSNQGSPAPQRTLLEGNLQKQGEKGLVKGWKKRYFCLKQDKQLRYYDGAVQKGVIDLNLVTDCKAKEGASSAPPFDFGLITETRIYHLRANTEAEREYWITGLNKVLKGDLSDQVNKKIGKGKKLLTAAVGAVTEAAETTLETVVDAGKTAERKIKYGDMTDKEIAAEKKRKKAEEKRHIKEKEKLKKAKDDLKAAEEKERARHQKNIKG